MRNDIINQDTDIIFSRKNILIMNQSEKELLPNILLSYIRNETNNDFPYPDFSKIKFEKEFKLLIKEQRKINKNENINLNGFHDYYCISNLRPIFNNFYEATKGNNHSSIEIFYDNESLLKVLKYRCGLNNSKKYTYSIGKDKIKAQETFNITPKTIRVGINSYFNSEVSNFSTVLAKRMINTLIDSFVSKKSDVIIYDPFGGWGSRMVAAASIKEKRIHYIYHDISKKSVENANKLGNILCNVNNDFSFECKQEKFCKSNIPKYDICITCPPYKEKELYDNNAEFLLEDLISLNNCMFVYNEELDKNIFAYIINSKSHLRNTKAKEYIYSTIVQV